MPVETKMLPAAKPLPQISLPASTPPTPEVAQIVYRDGPTGPNFAVTGGSAAQQRVMLAEAEYLRRELAKRHFGTESPAWKTPCRLSLNPQASHATRYVGNPGDDLAVYFYCSLDEMVSRQLPFAVTRAVVATQHGQPPAAWLDYGLADHLQSDEATRKKLDESCRNALRAGTALRLSALFAAAINPPPEPAFKGGFGVYMGIGGGSFKIPLDAPPEQERPHQAQAYSVVRFLAARRPGGGPDAVRRLLQLDTAARAKGWDAALAECYGYESADDLEDHWLAWLKRPSSVVGFTPPAVEPKTGPIVTSAPPKPPTIPATPVAGAEAKSGESPRIPPADVPTLPPAAPPK